MNRRQVPHLVAFYSIYLVYVPFMSAFRNLARRLLAPQGAAFAVIWLLQLSIGVTAGLLSHHFVERRCKTLRPRLIRR